MLLRRALWIGPIALAALFAAQGFAAVASLALSPGAADLARASLAFQSPAARADVGSRHAGSSVDQSVLKRAFDSSSQSDLNAALSDARDGDAICEGVRVRAIVASDETNWSFASLTDAGGRSLLRRRGEVAFDRRVVDISSRSVSLENDGKRCVALIGGEPRVESGPRVDPIDPHAAAGVPPVQAVPKSIRDGIVRSSPSDVRIDRSTFESAFANYSDLLRGVRTTPEKEDGRVVGMRLSGIRPGSVLALLGIENGDRLDRVGKYDVGDQAQMLEAYARLRTVERTSLQIMRQGKVMTLDVSVL